MTTEKKLMDSIKHPHNDLLRMDRMPHIWCPGCGIGTVFSACINGIIMSEYPLDKVAAVSGIGCSGRAAGYLNLDSFHTTHGRAIPFATGLKLANPDLKVVVFSGDGDLFAIGGNHLIHAARRNIDLTVICVNNLNYGMTGGQVAPSTPLGARTTTTMQGNFEKPFNFCQLAAAAGATYVARWTVVHIRRMTASFNEALQRRGFSFVEIMTQCPTSFGRRNKLGSALDIMKFYHRASIIRNNIDPKDAVVDLENEQLVLGKFVDEERPTFSDLVDQIYKGKAFRWPRQAEAL
jgi:2-oxoglutarate ferredoxin oxidoreductase subunit beta